MEPSVNDKKEGRTPPPPQKKLCFSFIANIEVYTRDFTCILFSLGFLALVSLVVAVVVVVVVFAFVVVCLWLWL